MPERTCAIEDCDRPVYGHGWCSLHWKRWRKHGDPSYVWTPTKAICSVDDCDQSVNGHGLCSMHYKRWRKHGDPTHERRLGRSPCVIDGCDSPNVSRGWCSKHYTRWVRYGSPTARMRGEIVDGKRICPGCGEDKPLDQFHGGRGYCRPCDARNAAASRRRNPPPPVPTQPRPCDACGATFPANKKRRRYCSRGCFEAFRHKANWIHVVTRRARQRDALVEEFDRIEIFERDGWLCGICGTAVDTEVVRPDPRSPSIDHIIPIARRGEHSRANVQTAHLGCNVRKGVSVA